MEAVRGGNHSVAEGTEVTGVDLSPLSAPARPREALGSAALASDPVRSARELVTWRRAFLREAVSPQEAATAGQSVRGGLGVGEGGRLSFLRVQRDAGRGIMGTC